MLLPWFAVAAIVPSRVSNAFCEWSFAFAGRLFLFAPKKPIFRGSVNNGDVAKKLF